MNRRLKWKWKKKRGDKLFHLGHKKLITSYYYLSKNQEKRYSNQHVGKNALRIVQFVPAVKLYISQTL